MQPSYFRPTKAQICLSHISANIGQVMAQLPTGTQCWAVVKANAYGHGAVAVARHLANQVDGFCVSNMDEALELRQAGLDLPILILGVIPVAALPMAKAHQISITIASQEWLDLAQAQGQDLAGLRIHIKVDSGMGRIGVRHQAELHRLVDRLLAAGAVFEGLFTHFATADEADETQFQDQLSTFKELVANLPQSPTFIHTSNSAASIWHAAQTFNAVRLGNIIYGLNPSGRTLPLPYPIQPALSLTSELIHVKQVPAGTPIGYGATYVSQASEWIGTVPIGYADGLTRNMQGFHVLIDGQPCQLVGRVSMDQITVRLPQAYPLGTLVTLIGENGGATITAQDWADQRGTINYEVLCLLSDRIPRNYGGAYDC